MSMLDRRDDRRDLAVHALAASGDVATIKQEIAKLGKDPS